MKRLLCLILGLLILDSACAPARPPLQSRYYFAPATPSPFEAGANLHSYPRLDLLKAMGAKWVRLNLDWSSMEKQPGIWNFEATDRVIRESRKAGLKVYACLLYSPAWASESGRPSAVPAEAAWRRYVEVVAKRYGAQVSAFGIWNEPNLEEFWDGNARDYAERLLRPASEIIHREAPGVLVAGPDLAQLSSAKIPVPKFFDELRRFGGLDCLDVISHHVYGGPDLKDKLLGARFLGVTYRQGLAQMLSRAGVGSRELWLTETGVNSSDRDEIAQAEELAAQWSLLKQLGWVRKAFIYDWADDPSQGSLWGLLRADGTPKPAYQALRMTLALPGT